MVQIMANWYVWYSFRNKDYEAVDASLCFVVGRNHTVIDICQAYFTDIDLIHKSQNAPVPYPKMLHSEQKCVHFCSEWSIMGYGTGAFWDGICEMCYIMSTSVSVGQDWTQGPKSKRTDDITSITKK